ncbi:MAG: hypothetical protein ABW019_06305 [Chitinophagaceae bacterium]
MSTPTGQAILDKLFATDLFKNMDTAALSRRYDIRHALEAANNASPSVAPQQQTDTTITAIPPQGILIDSPGRYQLAGDIAWSPTAPATAITITAANVVLDLQGHTVRATVPDSTGQYKGIHLTGSSITITNGILKGMTYYGVYATEAPGLQVSSLVIDGLTYTDTTQPLLTPCGIYIGKTDGFAVESCIVQNMSVTTPSCAGIQASNSVNGLISGCLLSNFVNDDGAVQGFSYLVAANILTLACACENFQSHYLGQTITSGHTVLGFIPIFCVDLTFTDCSSTNMTGCCDDCHGMSVFIDAFIEVNNFTAVNVTDGVCARSTGAKATGLEVYGIGVTCNNCTVQNIRAIVPQDLQSAGFSAWGSSITFNNCTATGVQVTDASGQPDTRYGYGVGFGWAPDPRPEFCNQPADKVQYNGCTASNCQLGFDTWYHTDSVWQQVNAADCPVFMLVQPPGTTRTLRIDKCSESPNGQYQQVTIMNKAKNITYA